MAKKYVYVFAEGKADGHGGMKELLGGKGANLAEMVNIGLPVPPGFTLSTEVCRYYYDHGRKYPAELKGQVEKALAKIEAGMGKMFGDENDPLLVSVRSGARASMPGMMETVLNVGLTNRTIKGLVAKTKNERFAYDAYRRLIMMYSDVVMEKAAGIEPKEGRGIRHQLEEIMDEKKKARGVSLDTQLTTADLKELVQKFKDRVRSVLGQSFPDDPREQLWGGIGAVFASWMGRRAVSYRRIEGIPGWWGTAVNVQAMVFGNMGDDSATGVGFTRNPATGERVFYGEWLANAQGEDVVAGIRTPAPINEAGKSEHNKNLQSLEKAMPKAYRELNGIQKALEKHYCDMQDIEFTIQEGRLFMLQCRVGKRNGPAAVKMAADMAREGLISKEEAVMRIRPSQLDELLHPMVDPKTEIATPVLAKGLPAGPGGANGMIVFTADDAESWAKEGKNVILVRNETSPEDVHGMHAAQAILTAKGGMTSHAALVARGWGKCCIVGCAALEIKASDKTLRSGDKVLREGDWITLNGTKGYVYEGQLPLLPADPERDVAYKQIMKYADQIRRMKVRTNADRPEDAVKARMFGAQGIGLCRTEHMFFDEERIKAMREMIVAETLEARRRAVMKLLPYQKEDFKGILKAMQGLPVTIRLLDPPLHEFVNLTPEQIRELAADLGVSESKLDARVKALHELNPMLGHRGCRLGIAYPEITEMQVRAIFEATAELALAKVKVLPEVMVPLAGTVKEFVHQKEITNRVADEVKKATGAKFNYLVGTMIELPRAALVADKIAQEAEFFSFGTNDLTQTTFGFSRDDIGGFLPIYLNEKILPEDPFQTIDEEGVGELVRIGVERGRATRRDLKIGICGEHGGDPASVDFCHRVKMDYVSCSPFRVPIARLAAAQATVREKVMKTKARMKTAKSGGKKKGGKKRR